METKEEPVRHNCNLVLQRISQLESDVRTFKKQQLCPHTTLLITTYSGIGMNSVVECKVCGKLIKYQYGFRVWLLDRLLTRWAKIITKRVRGL